MDGVFPSEPGIYLLMVWVTKTTRLKVGALGARNFKSGVYGYVGSAHGPGGLAARLNRHGRTDKKKRWHIDYLTVRYPPFGAIYLPGMERDSEEDLAIRMARRFEAVPGFGASDSRANSHLFLLGDFTAISA